MLYNKIKNYDIVINQMRVYDCKILIFNLYFKGIV